MAHLMGKTLPESHTNLLLTFNRKVELDPEDEPMPALIDISIQTPKLQEEEEEEVEILGEVASRDDHDFATKAGYVVLNLEGELQAGLSDLEMID